MIVVPSIYAILNSGTLQTTRRNAGNTDWEPATPIWSDVAADQAVAGSFISNGAIGAQLYFNSNGTHLLLAGGLDVLSRSGPPQIDISRDAWWQSLGFFTNGIERLHIDASGKIGIGTTSPAFRLEVFGASDASNAIGTTTGIFSVLGSSTSALRIGTCITPPFGAYLQTSGGSYPILLNPVGQPLSGGGVGIGTSDPGTAALAVMNGNVGIGTPFPDSSLDLFGSATQTFSAFSSVGAKRNQATISASWSTATDASRKARLVGNIYDSGGARQWIQVDTDGNVPTVTIFGAQLQSIGTGNILDLKNTLGQTAVYFDQYGQLFSVTNAQFSGTVRAGAGSTNLGGTAGIHVGTYLVGGSGSPYGANAVVLQTIDSLVSNSTIVWINSAGTQQTFLGRNYNVANSILEIGDGSTTKFLIDSAGNVGIGTTAPNGALQINAVDAVLTGAFGNLFITSSDSVAVDKGGTISLGGSYTGTTQTQFSGFKGAKENSTVGSFAGYLAFYTRVDAGSNTEKMRITSAGNVGIGTTTPNLGGFTGTVATVNAQAGQNAVYELGVDNSIIGSVRANSSGLAIRSHMSALNLISESGVVTFSPNFTEAMRLTTDGNVGIGTTSPASLLDLFGSATQTFSANSSTATKRTQATLFASWSTATDASRKARLIGNIYDTVARQWLQVDTDGTNPSVTLFGGLEVDNPNDNSWLTLNTINGQAGISFQRDSVNRFQIYNQPNSSTSYTLNIRSSNTGTGLALDYQTGNVSLSSCPTYADNAAAVTGGLATDTLYKTSTGEVRIVV